MGTINIDAKDFQKEVIESKVPVLVDFWASWCIPCKMMAPVLEEMADEFKGKLKIAKLNTDTYENAELASLYSVMSIPNMKIFKKGEIAKEFIGHRPAETFKKELQDFLNQDNSK